MFKSSMEENKNIFNQTAGNEDLSMFDMLLRESNPAKSIIKSNINEIDTVRGEARKEITDNQQEIQDANNTDVPKKYKKKKEVIKSNDDIIPQQICLDSEENLRKYLIDKYEICVKRTKKSS